MIDALIELIGQRLVLIACKNYIFASTNQKFLKMKKLRRNFYCLKGP